MMKINFSIAKFAIMLFAWGLMQSLAEHAAASTSSDIKSAASLVENSKNSEAEKLLKQIIKKANGENKYEAILIFARMKFQEKKFNEAIVVYKQIPSTSKFWIESLEERAWAELHIGDFEEAIALYNTMSAEVLSEVVGAEAYLIGAIAELRICNYKGVFDDLKLFKERFKPRIQGLSQGAASKKKSAELADIQKVIKKMHIIEIEAIQRMGLKRVAGEKFSKKTASSRDTISFPKESEEWLDEAKFEVSAKSCALSTPKISALKSGEKK